MKTCLHLILLAGLLLAGTTHAQSIDDNTEPVFLHARQQITSMLAADKQPSFEEAIYQLESAWYAGGIDYVSFKTNLDLHTQNIRTLINSINSPLSATSPDIAIPPQLAKTRNKNLIANYAIYTYLTQPTLWLHDSTLTIQQPVRYSAEDPMGTADWTNTHITHLLNNGIGNCFAMAALFKIFADRLGTDAQLCTAPGHIYIRHADENGTEYNVELAGRKFPGTGSIEAITYTTAEAVKNGIAMRQLDDQQAIALTLVYLAKARQYKTGRLDAYAATCAQTALQYDDKNLNAMLLKAEVMEEALLANAAEDIQQHPLFTEYQQWLQHIYSLGYRELPQHMKEKLVKGWGKKHIDEEPVLNDEEDTRYASLSWGLFDEQVKTEAVEQYGRTLFNTATQTIAGFATTSPQYNQYTYDPVIFAWEMDPLAHKMPGESPYSVLGNSPITFVDALGNIKVDALTEANYPGTTLLIKHAYELYYNLELPADVKHIVQGVDLQKVFNRTMRAAFEKHSKLSGVELDEFLKYGKGPTLSIIDLDFEGRPQTNGYTPIPKDNEGNFSNRYWDEDSKLIFIDNDIGGVLEFELTGKTSVSGIEGGHTQDVADLNSSMLAFFSTLFHEGVHYGRFIIGVGNTAKSIRKDGYLPRWGGRAEPGKEFEVDVWGRDVDRMDKNKLKSSSSFGRNAFGSYR